MQVFWPEIPHISELSCNGLGSVQVKICMRIFRPEDYSFFMYVLSASLCSSIKDKRPKLSRTSPNITPFHSTNMRKLTNFKFIYWGWSWSWYPDLLLVAMTKSYLARDQHSWPRKKARDEHFFWLFGDHKLNIMMGGDACKDTPTTE